MRTAQDELNNLLSDSDNFEGMKVIGLHYSREDGILTLNLDGSYPQGRFAIQFYVPKRNWPAWVGKNKTRMPHILEATWEEPIGWEADQKRKLM